MVVKIDATKWNADAMRQLYQQLVDERVTKIEGGKYHSIHESHYRKDELSRLEDLGAVPLGSIDCQVSGSPLRELRQEVLNTMLYQGLASLDDHVRVALSRVHDPLLEEFMPLMRRPWKGDAGLKAFQRILIDTGTDNHFMEIFWYVRTLAFVEIARRHPDKSIQFDENSSYFPHRLFPQQKGPTWKDLEVEIAEAFLSIFPEGVADAVIRIGEYIIPHHKDWELHPKRCGRFLIPLDVRLVFSADADEADLDALYNTPDIKRAVYVTLQRYFKLSGELSSKAHLRVKKLKERSRHQLGLSKTEYKEVAKGIDNYAYNQILNVWQTEGVIPTIGLAALLGLYATTDGETLTIVDPSPYRGTQRFTKQSRLSDTTSYLPFCVAILNRIYQTAREIRVEELQKQDTATNSVPAP